MREDRVQGWMVRLAWFTWGAVIALTVVLLVLLTPRSARAADAPMLLVASTRLQGGYAQTVVAVGKHASGMEVGLILNRPSQMRMIDLFPAFAPGRAVSDPIFVGGPNHSNVMFMLMRDAPANKAAVDFGGGVALVIDGQTIDGAIAASPNGQRYFVGMVIWRPGELDEELREGMWHPLPAVAAPFFAKDTSRLWRELLARANGQRVEGPNSSVVLGIRG